MRAAFLFVVVVHGLIHALGFAKAFGFAELPQLTQPVSRPWGVTWLVAGALTLAAAALLLLSPRWWWAAGALAVLVSQVVILSSWKDAKFGTLANLLLLLGVAYGFAARGPWSLRAEFERDLALATKARADHVLTEADLAPLPEPVRRYVRGAGVVGQPRVHSFHARWRGRIRGGPGEPWMAFTAEQLNTLDTPRRFFFMDAVMKGLPVDVLHAFDERGATMRVRLLSLKTMVDAGGEVLTRSETVTLFNDLCIFAPGELVRRAIAWEAADAHSARARYTQGPNTISATLLFDDAANLVDFVSDDRNPSPDGRGGGPVRWTTPVRDYARVGPLRVPRHAETRWHPASGAWTYGEFTLTDLAYDGGR